MAARSVLCNAPLAAGFCTHRVQERRAALCAAGHTYDARCASLTPRRSIPASSAVVSSAAALPSSVADATQVPRRAARTLLVGRWPDVAFSVRAESTHSVVSYRAGSPSAEEVSIVVRPSFRGLGSGPGQVRILQEVPPLAIATSELVKAYPDLAGSEHLDALASAVVDLTAPRPDGSRPAARLRRTIGIVELDELYARAI